MYTHRHLAFEWLLARVADDDRLRELEAQLLTTDLPAIINLCFSTKDPAFPDLAIVRWTGRLHLDGRESESIVAKSREFLQGLVDRTDSAFTRKNALVLLSRYPEARSAVLPRMLEIFLSDDPEISGYALASGMHSDFDATFDAFADYIKFYPRGQHAPSIVEALVLYSAGPENSKRAFDLAFICCRASSDLWASLSLAIEIRLYREEELGTISSELTDSATKLVSFGPSSDLKPLAIYAGSPIHSVHKAGEYGFTSLQRAITGALQLHCKDRDILDFLRQLIAKSIPDSKRASKYLRDVKCEAAKADRG